jgi:uncharacterized membrane protein YraQ (UPF0718 family)
MNLSLILQESSAITASVGRSFLHILPYLALSIPLAVLLKRTGAADKIRKGLGANPYLAVLLATLVGALSPFCSCGVIPIITALLLGGVPLAPVMSFWLASPSMDPEIFLLSVGSIGWELAIWRLAATFVLSLGGGLAVLWLDRKGWIGQDFLRPSVLGRIQKSAPPAASPSLQRLVPAVCCAGTSAVPILEESAGCTYGCVSRVVLEPAPALAACGCGTENKASDHAQFVWQGLVADTARTTLSLSSYMMIAFLLEALILRYVPQGLIASRLGSQSAWSVPLATLISIPMYTTNLTSLGLIAGLLQRGMSGGAALAFLIGGAVTTLPAMSAVYGIVRWRVFSLYLGFCIAGALLSGFAYQFVH